MPTRRQIVTAALLLAAPAAALGQPDGADDWSAAEIEVLRAAMARAERHGLDALGFARALDRGGTAATRAAVAWSRALATGLVDPANVHAIFTLTRNPVDAKAGLAVARAAGQLAGWMRALPPSDLAYRALSDAYRARLRQPAAAADIPAGPLIRAGDLDPRLPEIRGRLQALGWLAESAGLADLSGLDPTIQAALVSLQKAEGLAADVVVGPDTLEVLNLGPRDRARQLAVNLERRRWLTRRPPATRIDVNIAAARLTYFRDGAPVLSRRVVPGAPGHETPLLEAPFRDLVVNPPWYVPASIAAREILPRGPDYLQAHDMSVRDGRVVQAPGPRSALGRVKFDMANPYAIYLHDTPAKALFAASDRWRSHGCVRVEGAVEFARRLATERGHGAAFESGLESGKTTVIDLGEAIPVRLLYFTAEPRGDGEVTFARDAYGWDARLADRMALGPGRVRAPVRLAPEPLAP